MGRPGYGHYHCRHIERIGAPMEAPLIDVVIHYLANEEEPAASDIDDRPARTTRLSRVPAIGELIEASDGRGMEHVAQVVHARDGAVHAFVVPVSPPPHVARAFGITDTGVPSLVGFDGQTVGDMIAFLAQYPAEMPVAFTDHRRLVAKAKGGMVLLRLDEEDE